MIAQCVYACWAIVLLGAVLENGTCYERLGEILLFPGESGGEGALGSSEALEGISARDFLSVI